MVRKKSSGFVNVRRDLSEGLLVAVIKFCASKTHNKKTPQKELFSQRIHNQVPTSETLHLYAKKRVFPSNIIIIQVVAQSNDKIKTRASLRRDVSRIQKENVKGIIIETSRCEFQSLYNANYTDWYGTKVHLVFSHGLIIQKMQEWHICMFRIALT